MASLKAIVLGKLVKWFVNSGMFPTQKYLDDITQKIRQRVECDNEQLDFIESLVRKKDVLVRQFSCT